VCGLEGGQSMAMNTRNYRNADKLLHGTSPSSSAVLSSGNCKYLVWFCAHSPVACEGSLLSYTQTHHTTPHLEMCDGSHEQAGIGWDMGLTQYRLAGRRPFERKACRRRARHGLTSWACPEQRPCSVEIHTSADDLNGPHVGWLHNRSDASQTNK
jgi:hypothetical protein